MPLESLEGGDSRCIVHREKVDLVRNEDSLPLKPLVEILAHTALAIGCENA